MSKRAMRAVRTLPERVPERVSHDLGDDGLEGELAYEAYLRGRISYDRASSHSSADSAHTLRAARTARTGLNMKH
jgi:hypothetical protein